MLHPNLKTSQRAQTLSHVLRWLVPHGSSATLSYCCWLNIHLCVHICCIYMLVCHGFSEDMVASAANQTWLAGKSPLISGDFRASHVGWHQRYPKIGLQRSPNFSDHFMFPDFVTLWSSNISIFTIPHKKMIFPAVDLYFDSFSPWFSHMFPWFSHIFLWFSHDLRRFSGYVWHHGVFRGAMSCHGQARWSWKRPSLRATLHG